MMKPHVLSGIRISRGMPAFLVTMLLGCWTVASTTVAAQETPPVVRVIQAPAAADTQAVQWISIEAPGLGVMLAAVARPQGAGTFPAVLLLHGTHGFAQEYVRLARDLARGGFVSVAACWFSGGRGPGSRFVTPIDCPDAPPLPDPSSPSARRVVDALVRAVRALPGVRADRVALFGHSRGAGATLAYIIAAGNVQAAILNSAGYPSESNHRAANVNVPLLILHGEADGPADGGSAATNVKMAREFEAALRRGGKPVEAAYFEGGHNGIFTSATQRDAEVQRMLAFLRKRLSDR